MVIYKQEKKELIIPSGFLYNGCGGDDCQEAIEQAREQGFQSGYTAAQEDCDCSEECDTCYQQGYADGRESVTSGCPMQSKAIYMSDIETTVTPDYGYAGLDSVYINAENVYNEGFANGQASCPECDCSSAVTEAYQSGQTAQKALLVSTAITANNTYRRENGWNEIVVNVPQTGGSCNLQQGILYISDEGPWTLEPDEGYDGFSTVNVSDNGYGQSKYDQGYQSGYTAGLEDASGSSCNLVQGQFELYVGWPGSETINPPATADGFSSFTIVDNGYYGQAYSAGFEDGVSSGRTVGRREGYYQGEQSVIQSFFTGNAVTNYGGIDDYGYVVAYYYTPSGQMCVITGYDRDCDERWDDSFSSMSVDGGPWVSPQLYYYLSEGWHQIRFNVKDPDLHYAFNHNFPTEYVEDPLGNMVVPYMDALKAISIPEANQYQSGATGLIGTFKMNNGIRILSTSLKFFGVQSGNTYNGNALSGATNLNIIISHYEGNENVDIISAVQNGILFYPQGKASTHSSSLTGWTHMELF